MDEPFKDDREFWTSVGASVDALVTLVVAAVLVVLLGPVAAVAFAVPIALGVLAARTARVSTARTRPTFGSTEEWRWAERRAVAAALPRAFLRRRRLPGRPRALAPVESAAGAAQLPGA